MSRRESGSGIGLLAEAAAMPLLAASISSINARGGEPRVIDLALLATGIGLAIGGTLFPSAEE